MDTDELTPEQAEALGRTLADSCKALNDAAFQALIAFTQMVDSWTALVPPSAERDDAVDGSGE